MTQNMSMIIFLTHLGKTTSSSSTTQQPSISGDSMLKIQQIMHADIWQDILTKDRVYESLNSRIACNRLIFTPV